MLTSLEVVTIHRRLFIGMSGLLSSYLLIKADDWIRLIKETYDDEDHEL